MADPRCAKCTYTPRRCADIVHATFKAVRAAVKGEGFDLERWLVPHVMSNLAGLGAQAAGQKAAREGRSQEAVIDEWEVLSLQHLGAL